MVIVLGQGDHIAFCCDLEAATSAHFHIWALKLPDERSVSLEHCHMEAVSVAVADQHISGITDVDSIGVVGDVLTTNAPHEEPILIEHHNAMTLKPKYFHTLYMQPQ